MELALERHRPSLLKVSKRDCLLQHSLLSLFSVPLSENPPIEEEGSFPVVIVVVVVVLVVAVVLPVVVIVVIVVIVVLIRCRLVNPRRLVNFTSVSLCVCRKSKTGGYSAHPSAMPPGVDEDKRAEEMVSLSAINPTSPEGGSTFFSSSSSYSLLLPLTPSNSLLLPLAPSQKLQG